MLPVLRTLTRGGLLALLASSLALAQALAPVIQQITLVNPAVPGTVVILTGSGLAGATAVTIGSATDGAFKIVSDTEIDYTIPLDAPPGGILRVTTPAGTGTYAAPVPITAYIPPVYPEGQWCLPNLNNFHTLVNPSTGNTIVMLWCDLPTGTFHYAVSGSATQWMDAQCLTKIEPFNVSTSWLQHAWSACVDHVMPASDEAYAWRLFALWVPRPTVKGTGPQTIFTLASNGGLGSPLIAGTPPAYQTIAGGTVVGGLRIPGGNVTRFCDVSGGVSDQNLPIPANSYAACTLIYPPLSGFQFPTSTDKSSLQAPTDSILVDGAHHIWGIDAKGVVTIDGIEDSTSSAVIKLAYVSGLIWQKNASNLWWSKAAPAAAWLPVGGTATAPF